LNQSRPRIFIDGYNLGLEQGTGVATYARNLSFALRDLKAEVGVLYGTGTSTISKDALIREIAFFDPRVGAPLKIVRWARAARRIAASVLGEVANPVPITGRVISRTYQNRLPHFDEIWNVQDLFNTAHGHFKLYRKLMRVYLKSTPQIMHWTYPVALRASGSANIYTLHDLVPLRLPYTTLDNKRLYFRLCRMIVNRADHIVTVSETSRRDIIELLGCPEDKVTNTYQAVDIPAKYAGKPERDVISDVEGTFGLTYKRYFMFFGAIEPKKNIGRMIEAYLASGVEDPLVIVGKKAWKSEEELRLIFDDHVRYLVTEGEITRTRRKIIQIDYASFPLLVSLIRGAKTVLFPSLYEGFGLPALEAMKLGTPVMTSNTASIPEVVGDAAVKIDPYDVREMVDAIRALDADADLRGRLALAGPERAALFSPDRYRARLRDLYARLGARFDA